MKRITPITGLTSLTLFTSYLWIFRPFESYRKDKIDPSISSLVEPFSSISTAYWMDGGSIGIQLIDSKGTVFEACIPEPNHDRLFIGATHPVHPGAIEISNPRDSILYLTHIIRANPNPTFYDDLATAKVSGRLRDYTRSIFRNIAARINPTTRGSYHGISP